MTIQSDPTSVVAMRGLAHRRWCYALMTLSRELDTRFESLHRTGRVSKWYSAVGNEAATVSSGLALGPGDVLCTLHRDLGAILAVYLDPRRTFPGLGFEALDADLPPVERRPEPEALLQRLCCQLLGRADGFSNGVERSFHYAYLAPESGIQHIGMISHLGAMIPVAAGCALAHRLRDSDRVALNFIGDGGTSTGDFHEGLNTAAVWKLPLVLVIENNHYAFSTPTRSQYAARHLADRGPGYGVAAQTVDGNDPDEVRSSVERAVARARGGAGPSLIEVVLGRMRGHSEGDGSLDVVPDEERSSYVAADPLPAYARRLAAEGALDAAHTGRIEARVRQLVDTALERAMSSPDPVPETARRPVFAPHPSPPPSAAATAAAARAVKRGAPSAGLEGQEGPQTYIDAIHEALHRAMERDPRVFLMGQDIGAFQGAFRATRGLHQRWPGRVLDTPIAESGTLGIAAGAALLGYRPVVEMQFADFVSCGFNQLVNVIAKLYYRWQLPCPLVVRLPSGGGVGAGPFHSQNPEAWFAHVAGLKVVCPATLEDAWGLLGAAIDDPNPVLFFEHKYLYRRVKGALDPGAEHRGLGRAQVLRDGTALSLVSYGASTWTCLEAAQVLAREGVETEVVDLGTLVPYDEETVCRSVKKTGRVLVVHEAPLTLGFGAEIAARLADEAFAWLDAPVRRLAYPDRPVPYARVLEQHLLPTRDKVVDAARELLAF